MMSRNPEGYKLMARYHDKHFIYLYVFGHAKVMSDKHLSQK